ncbi:MAG: NAD(P)H-binding protein [Thermoflexales bacterium]|nr:NAD(P)H-binding protein [Thermoflexales bacterium]
MILITGSTGFVGQRVTAWLTAAGHQVCCLVRGAPKERRFPPGASVHVVVGDVDDPPYLRAAMQDVETIIHLAALYVEDSQHTFESVNYQGTLNVIEAAREAGVKHLIYLSHTGADPNSAYAFWRSKGLAEDAIRTSRLDFTILRSSMLYGEHDEWTTNIGMVLKSVPLFFPVAGDGQARFQPLWVEDIVKCIEQCLDNPSCSNKTLSVGGPEYFTLDQIIDIMASVLNVRRRKVYLRLPVATWLAKVMQRVMIRPLLTQTAIDRLSVNATTDLNTIQWQFGFRPVRFVDGIGYLRNRSLRREFLRRIIVGV